MHGAADGIAGMQEWRGGGSAAWLAIRSHGELRQRHDEAKKVVVFLATDVGAH